MIRHLRPLLPAAILVASSISGLAQSEPAALPVQPVPNEPQPELIRPQPQPQQKAPASAPTTVPAQTQVAKPAPADDSKARITKLEAELAAAKVELKSVKSQAAAVGGKAKDDRALADAERAKLKSQLAEMTAERDRTQSSLDQARINLASTKERLAIYEKTLSQDTAPDTEQLRSALKEAQQKVDMTVRAFEVVQTENNRIRAQMKNVDPMQLSKDLEQAKLDLADAQRQLAAEKYRSNNLARELARANPGMPLVIDESLPSAPTPPSAEPETTPDQPAASAAKTHTVADGETLSGIAKQYYGSASRWIDIFNANRDVLQDADHVKPGTELRLP